MRPDRNEAEEVGTMKDRSRREAVGVFHDVATLERAIDELESSGFDRSALSLLAGEDTIAEKLGHRFERVEYYEDDEAVPRAAYISREAVGDAEGGLVGGLVYVGAVAGGLGGVIGSALAGLVGEHHARSLQKQLDRGGILLWVRTPDAEHEARATAILGRHAATDVHVHDLPA
jgi:hypothetical protein